MGKRSRCRAQRHGKARNEAQESHHRVRRRQPSSVTRSPPAPLSPRPPHLHPGRLRFHIHTCPLRLHPAATFTVAAATLAAATCTSAQQRYSTPRTTAWASMITHRVLQHSERVQATRIPVPTPRSSSSYRSSSYRCPCRCWPYVPHAPCPTPSSRVAHKGPRNSRGHRSSLQGRRPSREA